MKFFSSVLYVEVLVFFYKAQVLQQHHEADVEIIPMKNKRIITQNSAAGRACPCAHQGKRLEIGKENIIVTPLCEISLKGDLPRPRFGGYFCAPQGHHSGACSLP